MSRTRELHEHTRHRIERALGYRSWAWLAREACLPRSTLGTQRDGPKCSVETLVAVAHALGRDVSKGHRLSSIRPAVRKVTMSRRIAERAALVALLLLPAAASIAAQDCTDWRLAETLRIGSLDGEHALTNIIDLAEGPAGEVYLAQSFTTSVWEFAPDGEFRRRIGRAGQGPGEFDVSVVGVGWFEGSLWAADLGALHFFDPGGTELRRVRFTVAMLDEGSRFRPARPLVGGSILGRRSISGDAYFLSDSLTIPRFDEAGRTVGIVARVPQQLSVRMGAGFTPHPMTDGPSPWATPEPDGSGLVLLHSHGGGDAPFLEVQRVGADGARLDGFSIRYIPMRVTAADRRWYSDQFVNHMLPEDGRLTAQTTARDRSELRQALHFPEYHPPVRRVVAGDDGSLWLLRELSAAHLVDRWEVYARSGELVGVVEVTTGRSHVRPWAPRLRIHQASRARVWATSIDEFDVSYVHRFDVKPGCPT